MTIFLIAGIIFCIIAWSVGVPLARKEAREDKRKDDMDNSIQVALQVREKCAKAVEQAGKGDKESLYFADVVRKVEIKAK